MLTILLLLVSNAFMTYAWYGHLNHKETPIVYAILSSWGIAFIEYCFMVPANRMGHEFFSAPQLKVIQEVITLVVFAVFSTWFLEEPLRWNHWVGFVMILAAVAVIFGFEAPKSPSVLMGEGRVNRNAPPPETDPFTPSGLRKNRASLIVLSPLLLISSYNNS
jgi:uncharacterized protein (DUF486 family)